MNVTSKCKVCGKRYKLPQTIKETDLRNKVCFKCQTLCDFYNVSLTALALKTLLHPKEIIRRVEIYNNVKL